MRCGKAKRLLSDYLDGRISGSLKTELENHLKGCKVCPQELTALRQTDELIKLKAEEHPSPEYWNNYWPRLKGKLEGTAPRSGPNLTSSRGRKLFPSFVPKFRLALNGVLAVLLILAVGRLYQDSQQIKSLRALLRERQAKEEILPPSPTALLKTSAEQPLEQSIRKQVKLFQEIREMFPQTIRWVVTNDGKIELGLASEGLLEKTARKEELPVFLQFKVLRHGRIPEIVSSPKIMVLSGNEINARLDGLSENDKTVYRYRCLSRLRADGQVDLLVRVSLNEAALETALIASEGEIELGKLRKGDAEYSIYVTVRSKNLNIVKAEDNKKI